MRYYFSLFLTYLTIACSSLNAQVNFVASKLEGCGFLTVMFTASSTGTISKAFWDFGDGKTSKELSPTNTYTQAGSYTVKLTVNDSSSAIIKQNYIKVRHNPDARFVILDSVSTGPYIYTLFAAHQPADTFIHTYSSTYSWIFYHTATSGPIIDAVDSGPVVNHQFDSTGIYMAALKVTDDFGCVDSFHHLIRASAKITVPNVFTPNDDNINDVLEIETNGKSNYLFSVFSPTGMLVYKVESKFIRWGGENLSGQKLNNGVYYYTLESLDNGNPFSQAGFIYLLR
jgi:gliding motility-associated-like protein